MKTLNIFNYSDYRQFLKDWFEAQKAQNKSFSYAQFAQKAGFEARSFLRLVIMHKRNLSVDGIAKMQKGLGLSANDTEGFRLLVLANQATAIENRLRLWEQFLSLQPKTQKSQMVQDTLMFLSRFSNPILLQVLRQPHVSHRPQDLAHMLDINLEKLHEGLEALSKLKIIRYTADGDIETTPELLFTTDDVPNVALQSYHQKALHKAIECLELPSEEREYQSVLISLSPEHLASLKKKIRQIADEIDQAYSGPKAQSEKVYTLNLNLIPVTRPFIRKDEKTLSSPKEQSPNKPQLQVCEQEKVL
ncbi:MAG: TIGR02147 family protein [Pseudobdellovibrionaceae bacterium]